VEKSLISKTSPRLPNNFTGNYVFNPDVESPNLQKKPLTLPVKGKWAWNLRDKGLWTEQFRKNIYYSIAFCS